MDSEINLDGRESDVPLCGVSFAGRRIDYVTVIKARFIECDFTGARISNFGVGAGREPTIYVDCIFDDANLKFRPGGVARFERCSFRGTRLSKWSGAAVELVDCTFTGKLTQCLFWGPKADHIPGACEFRGNDFSGAELVDCSFRTGIDLTRQRLPVGPGYFYAEDGLAAVAGARERVAAEPEVLGHWQSVLKVWQSELERGQVQLFDQYATWKRMGPRSEWAAVWGLPVEE